MVPRATVSQHRGEPEPTGEELFSRQAFRDALPEVSNVRLEQTIYAEYPDLKERIAALDGQKTAHTVDSLMDVWNVSHAEAESTASHLVEIGFFERRGDKGNPQFWLPFLYRPALHSIQGSAELSVDIAAPGELDGA